MLQHSFDSYVNYSSSNYGVNALVFTDKQGNRFWFSYKTLVAFNCGNGTVCLKNYWGTTTGKHLNAIEPDKKKRVDQETFDRLYKEAGF